MQKLIIVEDDTFFKKQLKSRLEVIGEYEFYEYDSVESALDSEIDGVNYLLLDHLLGGMNGVDALPNLRDKWKDSKILVITGTKEASVFEKAVENGAVQVLQKDHRLLEKLITFFNQEKIDLMKKRRRYS